MAVRYIIIILVVALLVVFGAVYYSAPPTPVRAVVAAAEVADTSGMVPEGKALRRELNLLRRDLQRLEPREPYIVINRHASRLQLRSGESVLLDAVCSAGSGAELVDSVSGRRWFFETPCGMYKVTSKLKDPWWRKPDWAFIEENEPVPTEDEDRMDPNTMGEFAIGFGDGNFIHGTLYERLLGVNVTHGCVRLGADDLRQLYSRVTIGTKIYVF